MSASLEHATPGYVRHLVLVPQGKFPAAEPAQTQQVTQATAAVAAMFAIPALACPESASHLLVSTAERTVMRRTRIAAVVPALHALKARPVQSTSIAPAAPAAPGYAAHLLAPTAYGTAMRRTWIAAGGPALDALKATPV
jgi:hypothetical protein